MKGRIHLILSAEIEFCERKMKYYSDLGYSTKITKEHAFSYWRGRKEGCEEIRSKIKEKYGCL